MPLRSDACFTFSNFVAASIVSALRPKLCLILGSLTYVAFVAANIHYNMIALYISSGFLGVGASVLWTAQGEKRADADSRVRARALVRGGCRLCSSAGALSLAPH